ncbi:MAG: response regulator [Phyllobacteriaceae bacterium]|nr:response regulator [Phyllobacteriaceae bacterium]
MVEDDPGVSDSLRSLLQALGHDVVSHPDAESFFESAPPSDHDVVIVDLGLPGIGGAQVIRWLDRLTPRPRVVAISGQPQKVIEDELRDIPSVRLLRKPLSGDSLVAVL